MNQKALDLSRGKSTVTFLVPTSTPFPLSSFLKVQTLVISTKLNSFKREINNYLISVSFKKLNYFHTIRYF